MIKKLYLWLILTFLLLIAAHHMAHSNGINLSQEQVKKIGQQIWRNECAGKIDGLTSWNKGEEFASIGIGHFIWYPEGQSGPFSDSFHRLLEFLMQKDVKLPQWLRDSSGCPWQSFEEFQHNLHSARMNELRELMVQTIDLQLLFIIERMQNSLKAIVESIPSYRREEIQSKFQTIASSPNGVYALIDYINFKGEGVSSKENYRGQGWGLLQVLEQMPRTIPKGAALDHFVLAAKKVLTLRVENSPKERNEQRWLKGWLNRLDTYKSIAF